jgi:hypothetical protein
MSNGRLRLVDDEFWDDYQRTQSEVIAEIARDDYLGLVLDAPRRVSLGRRDTVPVVGFFARTLRDDRKIRQEERMLVVAIHQDTDELLIGLALDTGKMPAPSGPPPDMDEPGEGSTVNMFAFDLRRVLGLSWEASRYNVAVLLREFVSNAVTIDLGRDATEYEDPAAASFLAEQRAQAVPPPPPAVFPVPHAHPETGEPPHYDPLFDMPVPEAPGICIQAPRVVIAKAGGKCILQGSYRLPVARRHRVEPRGTNASAPLVGDPRARAVVPIHLVVTGSDLPGPWVISLKVPVYGPLSPHPAEASGHFTIDLFQMPDFPRTPMTYFITAFSGQAVSQVLPIAVVSQQMIGV